MGVVRAPLFVFFFLSAGQLLLLLWAEKKRCKRNKPTEEQCDWWSERQHLRLILFVFLFFFGGEGRKECRPTYVFTYIDGAEAGAAQRRGMRLGCVFRFSF